jgi:hypothetical protein
LTSSTQEINIADSEQTNAIFHVVGGDTSAVNGDLNVWAATVPGNFALVEFVDSVSDPSLEPLSALATTPERATAINNAIAAYLSPQFSIGFLRWDPAQANADVPPMEKTINLSASQTNEVIVGLAMSAQDQNVSRLAIQVMNLDDGTSRWQDSQNPSYFNIYDYEKYISLVDDQAKKNIGLGKVAVGYCLSADKNLATIVGLFYQQIDAKSYAAGYLTGEPQLYSTNGPDASACEARYNPGAGTKNVLVGIGARVHDDKLATAGYKSAPLIAPPATAATTASVKK